MRSLYEAFIDVILDSTEEEIDEMIRERGEDPEELVRRGRMVIERALERFEREKDRT